MITIMIFYTQKYIFIVFRLFKETIKIYFQCIKYNEFQYQHNIGMFNYNNNHIHKHV
jgi:hypothetical protein